jgi:hypothetical protein
MLKLKSVKDELNCELFLTFFGFAFYLHVISLDFYFCWMSKFRMNSGFIDSLLENILLTYSDLLSLIVDHHHLYTWLA